MKLCGEYWPGESPRYQDDRGPCCLFAGHGGIHSTDQDPINEYLAAPPLPGVSASECRELEKYLRWYAEDIGDLDGKTALRAAAILRSVADAIDKGGEP